MDTVCRSFPVYMAEFRDRFQLAIAEHKWYMSEDAGRDVGYAAAVADFLEHHFDRFAGELRLSFCRTRCGSGGECRLGAFVQSIPSTSETLVIHQRKFRPPPLQAAG